MEPHELPISNASIGVFLEGIKRRGHKKALRYAMNECWRLYQEENDAAYLDTLHRLVLVKRLLVCYNVYNKQKSKRNLKTVGALLRQFGVL